MDIVISSNAKHMPAYFVSKAHIQTFQVAKHSSIDSVHFIAFHKSIICFLLHGSIRIATKSLNIFIKKPALVFVHYSKQQHKILIHVCTSATLFVQGSLLAS